MRSFIHRTGGRSMALAGTLGFSLAAAPALGAVVTYTDLSSWQAAAGSTSLETFDSATPGLFAAPVASTFGPVAFNGFTLSGQPTGDYIGITTTSLSGSPNNPIPAAFAGQNFVSWGSADGYVGPTTTITFNQPTKAFAFDWFNTDISDQYQITLNPQGDIFGGPPFTVAPYGTLSGFFGVVSDTYITSATISTQFDGGFVSDEGLDNVRLSSVPEPSQLALFIGLGGLALLSRRSRRMA